MNLWHSLAHTLCQREAVNAARMETPVIRDRIQFLDGSGYIAFENPEVSNRVLFIQEDATDAECRAFVAAWNARVE